MSLGTSLDLPHPFQNILTKILFLSVPSRHTCNMVWHVYQISIFRIVYNKSHCRDRMVRKIEFCFKKKSEIEWCPFLHWIASISREKYRPDSKNNCLCSWVSTLTAPFDPRKTQQPAFNFGESLSLVQDWSTASLVISVEDTQKSTIFFLILSVTRHRRLKRVIF